MSHSEDRAAIVCALCEVPFDYDRAKRSTLATCASCMVNRHRFMLKAHMIDYKGGGCQLCDYSDCHRSLDFHHIDPEEKGFHFGGKHNIGWDRIRAELDKCVLLCRNCHGEVEEAVELEQWGCRLPILDEVELLHALWEPPADFPTFTRTCWEEYHPKFRAELLKEMPEESTKKS